MSSEAVINNFMHALLAPECMGIFRCESFCGRTYAHLTGANEPSNCSVCQKRCCAFCCVSVMVARDQSSLFDNDGKDVDKDVKEALETCKLRVFGLEKMCYSCAGIEVPDRTKKALEVIAPPPVDSAPMFEEDVWSA